MPGRVHRIALLKDNPETRKFVREITEDLVWDQKATACESR